MASFDPVNLGGVWFVTVDEPWLCERCGHAKHWPGGGKTCLDNPLRIALTRTCRQWIVDPIKPPEDGRRILQN